MRLLFIVLLLLSGIAKADGFYVFTGVYAFNDTVTRTTYIGGSPNAQLGLKYSLNFGRVELDAGFKHESSMDTQEDGRGFNGLFVEAAYRL